MMTALLIAGILALSAAIALTFVPLAPSMVFALGGVWAVNHSGYIHVSSRQLMFWVLVTVILLLISRMSADERGADKVMRRYMSSGALAGTMVAAAMGATATTVALGPVAGLLAGLLFYCRTHRKSLTARGVFKLSPVIWPMVVTYSLAGITLIGFLS